MKNGSKIPSYRKHSRGAFAFIEHDGKRIRLPGGYGTWESTEAYRDTLIGLGFQPAAAAVVVGEYRRPSKVYTVGELVYTYLIFAERYYPGPRSEFGNMKNALRILVNLYTDLPIGEFGPRKLMNARDELVASGRSRNSINSDINRIRRVLRWAVSNELIELSLLQKCETVSGLTEGHTDAVEPRKVEPVEWAIVEKMLPFVSPVVRAMILFQRYTGARAGSVCQATPGQFDRSGKIWMWALRHKTERLTKDLELPIGPQCQLILVPFMNRPADVYMFRPMEARMCRAYGERYTTQSYRQAIERGCARGGVDTWTPHQARHARGDEVRNEFGLEAAQAHLGHKHIKSSERYAPQNRKLAIRVARKTG